jgi:glycosyltransferase involved in cell wall biosynthesis
VFNLPLRVFPEEAPLSPAAVISGLAYFVLSTALGAITVFKERVSMILAVYAFPQGVAGVMIGFLSRRKVAIQTDGGDIDIILRNPIVRPIILACLRRATVVTAQSVTKLNQLRSHRVNAQLCPVIGIDTSRFKYVPAEKKEKNLLLYAGRLSHEKSLVTLVYACSKLSQTGIDYKLLVVGDGPLREEIQNSVIQMNMKDNVTITGYISHQEIHEYYRRSSIFVLPSAREGRSVALLEAMSCGCLCIVSDIPDNRDLIQDMRDGLTFRVNDDEDLFRKLRQAISKYPEMAPLTKSARRVVEKNHSIESVGKRLAVLLSGL